jgi:hypothetical protein
MSDVAEEDQTPEQRLQWLRDHGVEIDMPADRVPPSGSSSGASQAAQRFTFVHSPADSALSYEEKSVEVPAGSSGDFLKVWLKSVFADKKGIDDKALQKQFAGTAAAGVSAAALTSVAAAGAVETFPLVKPSPEVRAPHHHAARVVAPIRRPSAAAAVTLLPGVACGYCPVVVPPAGAPLAPMRRPSSHATRPQNDYVGVSLYLDEVGALKNLPRNERGCALADACGLVDVVLYGELFVGCADCPAAPAFAASVAHSYRTAALVLHRYALHASGGLR